uniref:Uncharacterized protein LOC104224374 n=1 Tax=Nicotiana sylvestris TaxID=4096 RepID=A0A1U7W6R5_NICSY
MVSHGSQPQYSDQQLFSSPSAPISAPPLRYSQQSRPCFTYGDVRHISRCCPRASDISQQQGPRPMIQAPVAPQPTQPAIGGVSHGSQPQYSDQQLFSSPSAPISAPPLRYSQQSRPCFTYGDVRHISRCCPRASDISQQQGPRPMIQAPVAPQPTQPAIGG